jgi:ABC-2 type transport system permease protein
MRIFGFLTVYWRDMLRYFRFRTQLFSSLLQPALWLGFFGIAMAANFDRIMMGDTGALPGVQSVGYFTFMAAGVIAMNVLFTNLFGGFILLFDKNWGLMREMLASPMPRRDIIFGLCLSGVTKSSFQATVIIVIGLLLGVAFFVGKTAVEVAGSLVGIFAFIAVFAIGFLSLSTAIALVTESPEGFQGVTTLLTMPVFFASNALYPTDAFPEPLQWLVVVNPLTYLVTGIRHFAIGDHFTAIGVEYLTTTGDIALAFGALLIFAVATFALAWRTVERAVIT